MKIITWNVNGIRAAYKKGLIDFINSEDPDILCLQETKAHREQCEPDLVNAAGRESLWSSAVRKGYSGVATFWKQAPLEYATGIGLHEYDSEGRIVITRYENFRLYNIYFPNGGSGQERHDFKQKFLTELNDHLRPLVEAGEPIIVVGDYNVAHKEIDVYDPVGLSTESGFLPEERAWFDSFLALGFVDTFRHFHPKEKDRYTWWSMQQRARTIGNRGWRIDYICVTKNLLPVVKSADVLGDVQGSDHCPVVCTLEL